VSRYGAVVVRAHTEGGGGSTVVDGGAGFESPPALMPRRTQGDQRISDKAVIVVEPGLPFDLALKRFGRQVQRAGILRELKRRAHFTGRGERRREKAKRARARVAKAATRRLRARTQRVEWKPGDDT
jgi:small subunit ribosomal protein S21